MVKILELDNYHKIYKINQKITIGKAHLIKELKNILLFENDIQFNFLLDMETKADVNSMISDIVSMFGYWAQFPGSFKNLTQELLFSFFKDPENRHIKLLVMAIFVNEPRMIKSTDKTREKFKKTIKPLFFDPVKTKKKSNLVVI